MFTVVLQQIESACINFMLFSPYIFMYIVLFRKPVVNTYQQMQWPYTQHNWRHFIYFNEYHIAGVMIKSPDDELIQFETCWLFIDISVY
jgi:hypothetical protein